MPCFTGNWHNSKHISFDDNKNADGQDWYTLHILNLIWSLH